MRCAQATDRCPILVQHSTQRSLPVKQPEGDTKATGPRHDADTSGRHTPFYRMGVGVRPVSRAACPGVRDCSTGLWVICGARPSLARLGTRAFARSSALAASQHVTVKNVNF